MSDTHQERSNDGLLVAIDGPAGSGKSTVSKRVAQRLAIAFLDTGAMYRALTLACLSEGVPLDDVEAVLEVAEGMDFRFEGTPTEPRFLLGPEDVTTKIRSELVSENVSTIAALLPVRAWMATEQRRQMLAAKESGLGMVAEGRDITTVVCPDADVRVLLLADPRARIRRRTLELYGTVTPELYERTRRMLRNRDRKDLEVSQFMEPAEGVSVIDSSDLTVEQVVERVVRHAQAS